MCVCVCVCVCVCACVRWCVSSSTPVKIPCVFFVEYIVYFIRKKERI